jgi:hypothetical protein
MKKGYENKVKREEQKQAGVFDGRFRSRVVSDTKKQSKKYWARMKDLWN